MGTHSMASANSRSEQFPFETTSKPCTNVRSAAAHRGGLRRDGPNRESGEAVIAASGNTAMLESALLVVRGIECDADEQHHNCQENDAGKNVHDLKLPI
jgi:hypothetical protein